jgi:hypothetical protein
MAIDRGHTSIADILIENRTDVNARGGWHGSVLETAMQRETYLDDETRASTIALRKEHDTTFDSDSQEISEDDMPDNTPGDTPDDTSDDTPSRHSTPRSSRKWREITAQKFHGVYNSFRSTVKGRPRRTG